MMQAAQPRTTDHRRIPSRLLLYGAEVRSVLFQGIVNAVLMVVAHVLADQPPEMLFVQRDDVIEDLAAATSNPAFRNSILPGRPHTRSLGLQTGRLQKPDHVSIEFRVAVQDHVAICAGFREGLA